MQSCHTELPLSCVILGKLSHLLSLRFLGIKTATVAVCAKMLFVKHPSGAWQDADGSRWMGLHWIAGLISPGLCSWESKNRRQDLQEAAYKQMMVTPETAVPSWTGREGERLLPQRAVGWLPLLLYGPFSRLDTSIRPPVCPAVPAALHALPSANVYGLGRTRAPAVPPQHDLEDLAIFTRDATPYRGEVPASCRWLTASSACPSFQEVTYKVKQTTK